MRQISMRLFCFVQAILLTALSNSWSARAADIPRLQKNHGAWQLMVDNKPFLMRGGEFSNNVYEAPKDIQFLEMMLDAYQGYDLNTLLVPISWRSLEPEEGRFDYRMIDNLIEQCRKRDLRVVVLWFGAIKNGGLHYAPRWVLNDRGRFFRAKKPDGKDVYAVSPFCEAAWQFDIRAFTNLMTRIKEKDAGKYTVIMIQPENETGCQEIDETRDHCPLAEKAWTSPVPEDLMKYVTTHDGELIQWLQKVWERNGKRNSGAWPEVFGADTDGQKIFMSYYIGQFIERVATAGKTIHPLPMFINDWLGDVNSPGGPIGGPDFQMMDVFRVTTPSAFALCPDIYQENFKAWLAGYGQKDNPILVPEARSDARAAQQCWYTYFQHDGLLYSPYMLVPREAEQSAVPANLAYSNLQMSYSAIKEMEKLILAKQGLHPRELLCFELDKNERLGKAFQVEFQNFTIKAQATRAWGKLWGDAEQETPGFAAIMKMGDNDFVVLGKSMKVDLQRDGYAVAELTKGHFRDNEWVGELPLEVKDDATSASLALTEAFEAIEQVRI